MKLLGQYQSVYEAETLAEKLEERGIAAFVSSRNSANHSYATGAYKVGLWILSPEQYKEAKSVLSDPNYVVRNPLAAEDIARLKSQLKSSAFKKLIGPMVGLLGLLVAVTIFIIMRAAK